MSRRRDEGQILILFALVVTLLMGASALVVDIGLKYAVERRYQAVADAASLAGAQELRPATRLAPITGAMQSNARARALRTVLNEMVGPSSTSLCNPDANIVDCALPGGRFTVTIKTPSPTCVDCTPERAVQVTVSEPNFSTMFARLFGQTTWSLAKTSVAGLDFGRSYALVTLRPPQPLPNGLDQHRENIDVNGNNTRLNILSGDVGTNTSAVTTAGGRLVLATDYKIYHYDDISPDPWFQDATGLPEGQLIGRVIEDPNYPYASFSSATTYNTQALGAIDCADPSVAASYPTDYAAILHGSLTVTCYQPGIYQSNFNVSSNTEAAYLLPGAYRFDDGMDIRGSLMGGLISNQQGVVLVFPQSETMTANNAVRFWLNLGGETCNADGCRATGVVSADTGVPISIQVTRDGNCFSGVTPRLCSDNHNDTLNMPGNGQLAVAGILYAPSDFVQISGDNSVQNGYVGQIVAWRVKYSGGAILNQSYGFADGPGTIRIDTACSPGVACNP